MVTPVPDEIIPGTTLIVVDKGVEQNDVVINDPASILYAEYFPISTAISSTGENNSRHSDNALYLFYWLATKISWTTSLYL